MIQQQAQEKGFQAAFLSTWGSITAALSKKEEKSSSESGFDEESF